MSNTERPYIVRDKTGNPLIKTRVVIASTPAQAYRHVARDSFTVEPATAMELATLLTREGIVPESASASDDGAPF